MTGGTWELKRWDGSRAVGALPYLIGGLGLWPSAPSSRSKLIAASEGVVVGDGHVEGTFAGEASGVECAVGELAFHFVINFVRGVSHHHAHGVIEDAGG